MNFTSQTSATGQGNSPSPGDEHGHSAHTPMVEQPHTLHQRFGYPLPPMAGADLSTDAAGGDGDPGDGPFAQYLADVSEEHRPIVEPFIKKVEGDTTKRFQEHAEFRKTWEPYSELGLTDIPPQDLQGYLDVIAALSDPQSAGSELARIAGVHGLDLAGLNGEPTPEGDPADPAALREQIRQELMTELQPKLQQYDQVTQEHRVAQIEQQLKAGIEEINADRGTPLTKDQQNHVFQLSIGFAQQGDKEPLKSAYQLWTDITAGAEKGLLKAKQGEPDPHETGGRVPADAPDRPKTFEEAAAIHRERLHAQQRVAA